MVPLPLRYRGRDGAIAAAGSRTRWDSCCARAYVTVPPLSSVGHDDGGSPQNDARADPEIRVSPPRSEHRPGATQAAFFSYGPESLGADALCSPWYGCFGRAGSSDDRR